MGGQQSTKQRRREEDEDSVTEVRHSRRTAEKLNSGIIRLKETSSQLEKREELLQKRIDRAVELAKEKNRTGDKKAAMMHLRNKQQLVKQLESSRAKRMNLETQQMAMEETHLNAQTLQAMSAGAKTMKRVAKEMDVDRAADLMDDITENMDAMQELNEALAQPMGAVDLDDDELEAEMAELEEDEAVEEHAELQLPSVPAHKVIPEGKEEEEHTTKVEREMRELDAMFA